MQIIQSSDLISFGKTLQLMADILLPIETATDLDLYALIFNLLMLYSAVAFHLTLRQGSYSISQLVDDVILWYLDFMF